MQFGRVDRCGVTGKVMFPTKAEAQAFISSHGMAKGVKRVTRKCVFCSTYHTTKGERSGRKRRK